MYSMPPSSRRREPPPRRPAGSYRAFDTCEMLAMVRTLYPPSTFTGRVFERFARLTRTAFGSFLPAFGSFPKWFQPCQVAGCARIWVDQALPGVGDIELKVLHTPGHTPDSISLCAEDRVFTGDTLLVRATGRADFAGGDPGAQYDSITGKLFAMPDATLVYPAHDYRGHTHTTIGEEKRANPRIAGRSRAAYVELMNNLGLPLPEKIQEALQCNQSAIEDDSVKFPSFAQLDSVRQLSARDADDHRSPRDSTVLLDVRERDEYRGELGHIPGSILISLRDLASRAEELAPQKNKQIITICRAGVRSTTAAAMLTGLGFEQVSNLAGGMLDWNERKLPVEHGTGLSWLY